MLADHGYPFSFLCNVPAVRDEAEHSIDQSAAAQYR